MAVSKANISFDEIIVETAALISANRILKKYPQSSAIETVKSFQLVNLLADLYLPSHLIKTLAQKLVPANIIVEPIFENFTKMGL